MSFQLTVMRKINVFATVLFSVFILAAFPARAGTRTALVIGNGGYQSAPLDNPVNDARDVALVLERSGFDVTLKTDINKREMDRSVMAFGKTLLHTGGVGLFYYAGHGIQVKGRNYLVPADALIESESDIIYESLDVGRVLGKMEDARNNINIVILDACRDNPYARKSRSAARGLAKIDAPTGTTIAQSN